MIELGWMLRVGRCGSADAREGCRLEGAHLGGLAWPRVDMARTLDEPVTSDGGGSGG